MDQLRADVSMEAWNGNDMRKWPQPKNMEPLGAKKETDSPSRTSRRNQSHWLLRRQPSKSYSGLGTPGTWGNKYVLFGATKSMVNCYSSHGKPIQLQTGLHPCWHCLRTQFSHFWIYACNTPCINFILVCYLWKTLLIGYPKAMYNSFFFAVSSFSG